MSQFQVAVVVDGQPFREYRVTAASKSEAEAIAEDRAVKDATKERGYWEEIYAVAA